MQMELDVASIYYFIWSLVVLMVLCKGGELLEKLSHSIENLLHAIRLSRNAQATETHEPA